ncbi:MAG: hypothetical protein OXC26_22145 [Albidovulum sp.]|nr:hypothetical protein [Albidovulum sp.]
MRGLRVEAPKVLRADAVAIRDDGNGVDPDSWLLHLGLGTAKSPKCRVPPPL